MLRLLTEISHMTRVELAQNIGISESSVKKILAKMKASAWIERKGSNKNVDLNLNMESEPPSR